MTAKQVDYIWQCVSTVVTRTRGGRQNAVLQNTSRVLTSSVRYKSAQAMSSLLKKKKAL